MPAEKSAIRVAAGKLTSAIQKEWGLELGEDCAELSEDVMDRSHMLLHANSEAQLENILAGKTVSEYLGIEWVESHPSVIPFILVLEATE